jgi:L-lactate dehydrogenase complex protein LldG
MSSRDRILGRLRAAQTPFRDVAPVTERLRMTPMADESPDALKAAFVRAAQGVGVTVWPCEDDGAAVDRIVELTGVAGVITWDWDKIGVAGLGEALAAGGATVSGLRDETAKFGITGVSAALATTGSLVIPSGAGQPRAASLLPPVHIAVVRATQIVTDLEAYFGGLKAVGLEQFRASANVVVVTGSSRTADIGQELILGAHGPIAVHVVLIG